MALVKEEARPEMISSSAKGEGERAAAPAAEVVKGTACVAGVLLEASMVLRRRGAMVLLAGANVTRVRCRVALVLSQMQGSGCSMGRDRQRQTRLVIVYDWVVVLCCWSGLQVLGNAMLQSKAGRCPCLDVASVFHGEIRACWKI